MANQECPIQVVLAGDFIDCTLSRDHGGPHSWQVTGAPETRPEPWTPCGECDRGIRWIPSPMCTCATGPNGEHHPYCGAEPCPNGCFDKLRPGVPVTAPDATQMAHCRDCAHRLGSGCGCECCPWAGEAVLLAAGAIHAQICDPHRGHESDDVHGFPHPRICLTCSTDEEEIPYYVSDNGPVHRDGDLAAARAAVQAALPGVRAAAAAEERERLARALLGCLDCGEIHTPHPATAIWTTKGMSNGAPFEYESWAAPDGHPYRRPSLTGRELADLLRAPGA